MLNYRNMDSFLIRIGAASLILFVLFINPGIINAAEFKIIPGKGKEIDMIIVQGDISLDDDIKFRKIAFNIDKAVVVLNSPGGLIAPALEIGKSIYFKGFTTAVINSECASSCALIWLSGKPRAMTPSAYIGFHAAYLTKPNGDKEITGSGNALVGNYLRSIGMNDMVISYVTSAKPDEILRLKKSDADSLGLFVELLSNTKRAKAYHNLAISNRFGKNPNIKEAFRYYKLAAEDGFAGSQNNLGDLYEDGIATAQNDKAAIYWYTRSAERGEPTAYLSLSTLLPLGTEDKNIITQALMYAILASNGLPDGKNKMKAMQQANILAGKLSEDERKHAVDMARQWYPLYQEQDLMSDSPR